ncbi:MAG: cytochrome c1 [Alphaproteobacteria bacterium]|nr:cytochrome c1 [Alphaproteobacteria bacterium]
MRFKPALSLAALAVLAALTAPAFASEGALEPREPPHGWHHAGPFGTFDRAALQRGFQVYKEVCAACHSLKLLSYRNLQAIGFNEAEVKAIAAQYTVTDGPDDNGDMYERPARPSDRFVSPFANDNAARASNNGALPPDLSLIAKARHGGESYLYSILTGYAEPTEEDKAKMMPGMHFNSYFPGHQIAMPAPLAEGMVSYADGTEATTEQMAADVATFLTWAAEPKLEERKKMGLQVLLFLLVFAGIMYVAKRRVWEKLH